MDQKLKTVLFILLLALLWLPIFQQLTRCFKEPELKGAFEKRVKPEISFATLSNLDYQKKLEDYENYNFGFRGLFVKIRNSLNYIMFRDLSIEDNIAFKDGFIFSVGSVYRTKGHLYNGKEKNDSTILKIKWMKEGLERHGGHLLVLIAPSKESVLPDYLPPVYRSNKSDKTDYKDFVEGYKKYNIPFIDFVSYFKNLRDTGAYPLFTKTGFHWSVYGASLAQDSLLGYIQHSFSKPMPSYVRNAVEWSDIPRHPDADFEDPLNLFFSIHQQHYVYPKTEMIQSSLGNYRPKVLIIGDSFFWQIKQQDKLQYIFSEDSKYWYYFAVTSFPLSNAAGIPLKTLNLKKEIETSDYVLLIGSPTNSGTFPFGITDYYCDTVINKKIVEALIEQIKNKRDNINNDNLVREKAFKIYDERKTFLLKACNDRYVSADQSRNDRLIADRWDAYAWETFTLLTLDNNECAVYSSSNKFLSVELNYSSEVAARRTRINNQEIFTLVNLAGDSVAFKAVNGKYLSVDEKSFVIFANGDTIGNKEKYLLINK